MYESLVETETSQRLKSARKARQRAAFVRAPWDLVCRADRIGPHALIIMLALKRLADMRVTPPFTLGDQALGELGILPRTRDRTLVALEAAGLIRVERHRGRLPRIWLEPGDHGSR
jgi:hypothetical protein